MCTSDIDNTRAWLRRSIIFTSASVLCAVFGAVYELFSHGVYSYSMIYAFAYPLVLGALPCLVMALIGRPLTKGAALDFYVFAIAFATVGSIVNGVLEIYGTSSRLMTAFPVLCGILVILALVFAIISAVKKRRSEK